MKYFNKMFILLFTSSSLFLLVGHGCGNFEIIDGLGNSLSSESAYDFDITPMRKTTSSVYAKQFLNNMVSCTGLRGVDPRTTSEFENRKGSLSEYGYAVNVTGPSLMAVAAVAGEVCADLIAQDPALPVAQQFFNGIDLSNSNATISANQLEEVVAKLALSCWQRQPEPEEFNTIINGVLDDSNSIANSRNTASATSEAYQAVLATCTSILASTSAIEM